MGALLATLEAVSLRSPTACSTAVQPELSLLTMTFTKELPETYRDIPRPAV